jgi:aerobic-type carbon monoxide dehydrogenase small subunit (CoxS/CutS family)
MSGTEPDSTSDDGRPSDAFGLVRLTVNGDRRTCGVPTHYTLLETLRYGLGLTGSKQGCDKGDCGACTVIMDGRATLACLTPVWEAEGKEVRTVEGLAGPDGPHPLQDEFDLRGAAQCGFCTPGILCSSVALLEYAGSPTRTEIQEALAGNLCRCTGYEKIYEAVEAAAARVRSGARPAADGSVSEDDLLVSDGPTDG